MNWYLVRVIKKGFNVIIILDEFYFVSSLMRYGINIIGELFFGGYLGKI